MRAFKDRHDAGRKLAKLLARYSRRANTSVLALPLGGVPVGYEVALALELPLDVLLVRKVGAPGWPELAMGAIASGEVEVRNQDVIDALHISDEEFSRTAKSERHELKRRERLYRGDRPPIDVAGRTIILVDNGIATGSTMLAAIRALRTQGVKHIVVAIPVAPADIRETFSDEADEVVCVLKPDMLYGVGASYEDFSQTTDEEVQALLEQAWTATATAAGA